jgi:hypothetical protein
MNKKSADIQTVLIVIKKLGKNNMCRGGRHQDPIVE